MRFNVCYKYRFNKTWNYREHKTEAVDQHSAMNIVNDWFFDYYMMRDRNACLTMVKADVIQPV